MYPIRCESSTVSCIPALLLKEQQGLHIIFQGEHTYICHVELFTNYARNTTCSLPWVFPFEGVCAYVCVCVTAFITPETRVGLSDRKHWLIQVSGVWVKEGSLSVYVHQLTGVVSAADNMLTHQQAHFQVTSPHMKGNMTCR